MRSRFSATPEPLEARTLLSVAADVGGAEASPRVAPSLTVRVGEYVAIDGRHASNDAGLYFTGAVSSPDARVDVYASLRGRRPVLIGQTSARSDGFWILDPAVPLADGVYTIQARAVDVPSGLAGPLTTMGAKLLVDNAGPRVMSVQMTPGSGRIVVTYRDFGGDRNAGTGVEPLGAEYRGNYTFLPLAASLGDAASRNQWRVTGLEASPARPNGLRRVVVTINDGAPIPDGSYQFHVKSPGPAPSSPFYPPFFPRPPLYAQGVGDGTGNPLDGGRTGTIAAEDSNDYATALVVRNGRAVRPGAAAPGGR